MKTISLLLMFLLLCSGCKFYFETEKTKIDCSPQEMKLSRVEVLTPESKVSNFALSNQVCALQLTGVMPIIP